MTPTVKALEELERPIEPYVDEMTKPFARTVYQKYIDIRNQYIKEGLPNPDHKAGARIFTSQLMSTLYWMFYDPSWIRLVDHECLFFLLKRLEKTTVEELEQVSLTNRYVRYKFSEHELAMIVDEEI